MLRGAIFPPESKDLVQRAEDEFGLFVGDVPTLSHAEVYAGKLCAALDRQHPRDLFDVKILLDNDGLSEDMLTAFTVYLASSTRPISEILRPNSLAFQKTYEDDFAGMSYLPVSYEVLTKVRQQLIQKLHNSLAEHHREFLLSIKSAKPNWDLIPIKHLQTLPALQWKLINIKKMDDKKRQQAYEKLCMALET